MLARSSVLSLAFSLLAGHATALPLDVDSQDSIKSVAKTLANGIVSFYDATLKEDLVPGLFPDPYYWWESGLAFNALIDYYGLTNDSEYNTRVSEALQHQLGDSKAFMPANQTKSLGNDDQSTWGLASLSAFEAGLSAPTSGSWLQFAQNVFETQIARWDTQSCDGGLKWQIFSFNSGYNYKNAISSGQLFLLAARLAEHTGNGTYTQWANKVYNWTTEIGLVSDDYHIYDGTDDTSNCSTVNHIQWSNNHAMYTEGVALMYKLSNSSQAWVDTVKGFVNASSVFTDDNGALREVACEGNGKCSIDQRAFKGTAARSFGRAAQAAPFVADSIYKTLGASAKAAASSCTVNTEDDVACNFYWNEQSIEESGTASNGHLGEVLNALQAVQALLWRTSDFSNSTSNSTASANATSSGSPSDTSGAPQSTGAGSTVAASFTFAIAVAFAAALSC
ncbi:hydrolase 76 protein [Didymella heteroderae]|uniref:Mannan endo-1,6-alpha-mannosidase n=1 Tax=Didymella heteroderae TaxID=1769908 RepID=A0A9P4WHA3_9PLEO|nr:hydrolase 76 protein [Didymella heteroderae]